MIDFKSYAGLRHEHWHTFPTLSARVEADCHRCDLYVRAMKTSGVPPTEREKQILRRVALGRSDADIARQIGGTEAQVATQRLRLIRKLNICSHAEIIEAAINLGPWPRQMKYPNLPSRVS